MWPVILLALLTSVKGEERVVADTEYGQVRGQTIPVNNGLTTTNINTFYQIPFGASTEGPRRFLSPVKPDTWEGVREAATPGTACGQRVVGFVWFTHPAWTDFGEDCLNLNIYAPADVAGGPYPVMVWFYGGAFQSGANINYPGHFLASHGVVVVVPNYRVGNLGFAYTADEAAPGNAGLWDQQLSLQFVRDNIGNFGGDPKKVTIFGQSAGAASTSFQFLSPASQGLSHQAIMESGTALSFWAINAPESHPENYTKQVAEELDCYDEDSFVMMDCLRELPWLTVFRGNFTCAEGYFCLGMAPVIDGPGGFLPQSPYEIRQSGNFTHGPIITGMTRDDGSLYTLAIFPGANQGDGFNRTQFLDNLEFLVNIWGAAMSNVTVEDLFQAMDYNYSPWPYVDTDYYGNRQAFNEMITDAAYGLPWDTQAKSQTQYAPTYEYIFNYRGRNSSSLFPEWMGVPHMGELPYVWGYPLLKINDAVRNDSLIFFDVIDWTEEDIEYATYWTQLWTNFAKTGNPTPVPVDAPNNLGPTTWDPFAWEDMNYLYISNVSMYVGQEWRQKDYAFWTNYMTYIAEDYLPTEPVMASSPNARAPRRFESMRGDSVQRALREWTAEVFSVRLNELDMLDELVLDLHQ